MGAHRGELGGASLVRFLAESIVGYLGGKGGGIVLFPPQISVDFLREVVREQRATQLEVVLILCTSVGVLRIGAPVDP